MARITEKVFKGEDENSKFCRDVEKIRVICGHRKSPKALINRLCRCETPRIPVILHL